MKKIILSIVAVMSISSVVSGADTIHESLKNGKFSVKARVFYFDRSFDKPNTDDAQALTAGGIMKYESESFNGLKVGFAYYGSHRLGGFFSREEGKGSSILGRKGEDLNFLGEAYLQYNVAKSMIKVGRQKLSTPLMQNHDLRILPSVYEAAVFQNKDIPDTTIELGHVWSYTGFTSKDNKFLDQNAKWGKDGLAYISIKNSSVKNLSVRAQYITAISDKDKTGNKIWISDYRFADAKYLIPIGTNTYIKAQYGGNSFNQAKSANFPSSDSRLLGAKLGTTFGMFDVTLLVDDVSGNAFKAIESGPMYSDWQQGYGPYEPSTAVGGQLTIRAIADLSVKLAYVDVSADKNFRTDGTFTDDYQEFNVDAHYKINDYSKLRVRYSKKDQSSESDRENRDDFRIIYYINF